MVQGHVLRHVPQPIFSLSLSLSLSLPSPAPPLSLRHARHVELPVAPRPEASPTA